MKTVTEHLRNHLLASLGYAEPVKRLPTLESLRLTEWCHEFEELRRNRMIIGAFRYGLLASPEKWGSPTCKYDLLGGLEKKVAEYRNTGNLEALVDAGNYLMLEFMHPSHESARFDPKDDHYHCPTR
jgi:hypothetical protein